MASHYQRNNSPYYWIRYQKPDGTWGDKTTKIRIGAPNALRRVKQFVADHTLREHHSDRTANANRFDSWVPAFLAHRYPNEKTRVRYGNAWSALSIYLDYAGVIAPSQVNYRLCVDYPRFRTDPPKKLLRPCSHNTALMELKVFSAILQEAVRRDYIAANPCMRLGLRRTPPKKKLEITEDDQRTIESALQGEDEWMHDSWLIAMRQGCRLSETAVPLDQIDPVAKTISFVIKGGRTHTAPLHSDLLPLYRRAKKQQRSHLVTLPKYPAKKWHQFLRRIGRGYLSFHCTRVTVVTRFARAGIPMSQAMAYVGHASSTVHAIYQRLAPDDVRRLGGVLKSRSA